MLIISLDNLSVETIAPESGPTEAGTKNISLTCIVHHDGEEARFPSAEWWTATAPVFPGDDIELTETVTNAIYHLSLPSLVPHTPYISCWPLHMSGESPTRRSRIHNCVTACCYTCQMYVLKI